MAYDVGTLTGMPNPGVRAGAAGAVTGRRGVDGGMDTVGIAGRGGTLMLNAGAAAGGDVGSSDGEGDSSQSVSSQLDETVGPGDSVLLDVLDELVELDVLDDSVVVLDESVVLLQDSEVSVDVSELLDEPVTPAVASVLLVSGA
jgi:hypothetical protein